MSHVHSSVLLSEVLTYLIDEKCGLFLDCTLGEGGHSYEILKKFGNVKVYGIDRDKEILSFAFCRLGEFQDRFKGLNINFKDVSADNLCLKGGEFFDSALIDLGISQFHYKKSGRGFSFLGKERLDMRLDDESRSVFDIINYSSQNDLADIFFEYAEERFAKKIAFKIVNERSKNEIEYSDQLAEIIGSAVPKRFWPKKINPATRCFQALRMAANNEIENIKTGIPKVLEVLRSGGKLGVITFHSIEDRVVKRIFNEMNKECVCPPGMPICVCGKIKEINWVEKMIKPSEDEVGNNPSARSAKLRIVEKI